MSNCAVLLLSTQRNNISLALNFYAHGERRCSKPFIYGEEDVSKLNTIYDVPERRSFGVKEATAVIE
jgi:hypothetical protein